MTGRNPMDLPEEVVRAVQAAQLRYGPGSTTREALAREHGLTVAQVKTLRGRRGRGVER